MVALCYGKGKYILKLVDRHAQLSISLSQTQKQISCVLLLTLKSH